MFAVLAEDKSDADVITQLIRRHLANQSLPVKPKGYEGCATMCRKGARDIKSWVRSGIGVSRVVVCHDADCNSPADVRTKVLREVIEPSGFDGPACIVVPVQEIEAWIIADEQAINKVIPKFRFKGHPLPESINNPKEWLRAQSRAARSKPLYSSTTFNPAVAERLSLEVVAKKCPSFRSFLDWLNQHD